MVTTAFFVACATCLIITNRLRDVDAVSHAGPSKPSAYSKIYAVAGEDVTLTCPIAGVRGAKVLWKKIGTEFHSDERFEQLSTHAYDIRDVQKYNDAGFYYCYLQHLSHLGNIADGLVELIVTDNSGGLYFKTTETITATRVGSNATLTCNIFGDTPISVQWKRNNQVISNDLPRILITNRECKNSFTSQLIISKVLSSADGDYQCIASNKNSKKSIMFELIIQDTPLPPEKIYYEMENRTIEIFWSTSEDRKSPIMKYIIQFKRKEDTWLSDGVILTLDPGIRKAKINHLTLGRFYEFRVAAENGVGIGDFSSVFTIDFDEIAPCQPPMQVKAESKCLDKIRVSWKPPKKDHLNRMIRGYYIGHKLNGSSEPFSFTSLEVPANHTEDLTYQLEDLKSFAAYIIVVQAYNNGGRGPSSEETVVKTSESFSSEAPQNVKCTSLSSRTIYIVWDPPPSDTVNGIITGYKVIYMPENAMKVFENPQINITNSSNIMLKTLEIATNYSIQVSAFTIVGDGVKSNHVYCKTEEDVPGAPTNIRAFSSSKDSILISWNAPLVPSNVAVIKYKVYYIPVIVGEEPDLTRWDKRERVVSGNAKYLEVDQLSENAEYAFWVTASSVVGEGPRSTIVRQIVAPSEGPPKMVSLDDNLKICWKQDIVLPCLAVSLPSHNKTWLHNEKEVQQNGRRQLDADGQFLIIRQSIKSDSGIYVCKDKNEYGMDTVKYEVTILAPPAPTSPPEMLLLSVYSINSSSISLGWLLGNAGDLVVGYNLHYKSQSLSCDWHMIKLPRDTITYTLEHLDCDTTYDVYLESVNSLGEGLAISQPIKEATCEC